MGLQMANLRDSNEYKTVQQMANEVGNTVSAIYNMINRTPELKCHVHKIGNRKLIDIEGQNYILEHSQNKPEPVDLLTSETYEELKLLRSQVNDLHNQLHERDAQVMQLLNEKAQLTSTKERLSIAEENYKALTAANKETTEENTELKVQNAELKSEIDRLHKRSLFQRIFNK